MTRSIYTIALFILIHLSVLAQNKQTITMGFYNVENLFDTLDTPNKEDQEYLPTSAREWNSERYWTKIDHINKVIKALETPAILGMCEVENKAVVQDIVDRGELKDNYSVLHYESLDVRGIDNALIYNKTFLTLIDSGILRFDMPEGNTPSRDILWGKFTHDKDTIFAIVNHWPSRRGGQVESEPKRLIAATAAKKFIDSLLRVNKRTEIIFMGDLNDHPDNMAPEMVSSLLKPMISSKSGQFGGSHSYRGEWGVLDHIMISKGFLKKGGLRAVKKSGKILSEEFMIDEYKGNNVPYRTYGGRKYLNGYSDHFPVMIQVYY
jgi:predicted extracellular nuclease